LLLFYFAFAVGQENKQKVQYYSVQDQHREYLTRQLLHSVAVKQEQERVQKQEQEQEVTIPTAMPEVLTQNHNKASSMIMNRMTTISPTLSMNGSSNEATNCK